MQLFELMLLLKLCDEDHYRGPNSFCELSIVMIGQIPIDYMHLVCLCVALDIWSIKIRIGEKVQQNISDLLLILRKSIPMEFARKPKAIADVSRWKATEFRQFVLYTDPLVRWVKLLINCTKTFFLLSVGIGILRNPDQCVSSLKNY